jgi:hypothetical protein
VTDPDETIRRGQRAEQILDDDLVKEALGKMKELAIEQFRAAAIGDDEALRAARAGFDAAERFEGIFKGMLRDGKYELDKRKPPLKPDDQYRSRNVNWTM